MTESITPLRVAITGASGLVGRTVSERLKSRGHSVFRMVRTPDDKPDSIYWKPSDGTLDPKHLRDIDIIVHLAGENIAAGRWTDESKKRIKDSRVNGTTLLASAMATMDNPPKALICASAIGYYGSRDDEILTESAEAGTGFLADVTTAWEASAQPAIDKGIRTAFLRIGVVLSTEGGALPKMLTPFKAGLAGKLGSGTQYMSWVSLDDVARAFVFAVEHDSLSGSINMVSPTPVTNAEFTDAMASVLRRPAKMPVPVFALKMMLGEMADELLLASMRVVPEKLQTAGFTFEDTDLTRTLAELLDGQEDSD